MMLKTALFAAALAGMATATTTGASAWTREGYQRGYHSDRGDHYDYRRHDGWRDRYHTTTECIHGRKVLLRKNAWGRVVSRTVVGHCGNDHHYGWWRR